MILAVDQEAESLIPCIGAAYRLIGTRRASPVPLFPFGRAPLKFGALLPWIRPSHARTFRSMEANKTIRTFVALDAEDWRWLRSEAERHALARGGRASVTAVLQSLVSQARAEQQERQEREAA